MKDRNKNKIQQTPSVPVRKCQYIKSQRTPLHDPMFGDDCMTTNMKKVMGLAFLISISTLTYIKNNLKK